MGGSLWRSRSLRLARSNSQRYGSKSATLTAGFFRLLLSVFWPGLFHLRNHLRAGRINGYDYTRGRADGDADRVSVDGWVVHGVSGHSRTKLQLRFLGIDGAVLCANHDDGADRFSATAILADSLVVQHRLRDRGALAVVGFEDLPHWHVDVWQESYDSGSRALGETELGEEQMAGAGGRKQMARAVDDAPIDWPNTI